MYIKKLIDENIGPIEQAQINFPFNQDGTPKPVIIVGENGSGKSTLLSNIVDAFYLLADNEYTNAMIQSDDGSGKQYYKAISPVEIHSGNQYLLSYIQFDLSRPVHYIFKSGNLSIEQAKTFTQLGDSFHFNWDAENNLKQITGQKNEAQDAFEKGVICYFGPDRYEKPFWQGEKYYHNTSTKEVFNNDKIAGKLRNPIAVQNINRINKQWIMDVIIDSRVDMVIGDNSISFYNIKDVAAMTKFASNLFNNQAKLDLERILSSIIGKQVYLSLNNRKNTNSRLSVLEKETNKIIAPSLDSLSTGQISLFNLFSTIIHYADNNDNGFMVNMNNISGIVVIDEVELHLHTNLQKEVLPKLIKLFPKVQFIITSHSPLFLLGMQEQFGDDGFEIYNMPYAEKIDVERFSEFQRAYEYFKNTVAYQKDAEAAIEDAVKDAVGKEGTEVLVITEGATDWKHMKSAYASLASKSGNDELFSKLNFDFLEFEPENSPKENVYKLSMGNTNLENLCENLSKIPQTKKYIFIADRDNDKTNKKLSCQGKRYKSWGNNVYSFILPVPDHRKDMPDICIEHLFTDDEIRTEVECNGIKRRLYIGYEFDDRGIAKNIDRVCEKNKICGEGKYNIIEGSQGEKVTSIGNENNTNYALPKMEFANYVANHQEEFNFDSFLEIFKIIKEILSEGEKDA